MSVKRFLLLALCVAVLFGCGGNEMSMAEYIERTNVIAERAGRQGEVLIAEGEAIEDFTPQHVESWVERGLAEIRIPLQEAADAIEPPERVADLHHLLWDWHAELIAIEEALAVRAGSAGDSVAGWTSLSDSSEMAAYRKTLAEGKQLCLDFQAELDDAVERGVFADTSWIPGEMEEAVEAVLGCSWYPDNPDDVYRYPPTTVGS